MTHKPDTKTGEPDIYSPFDSEDEPPLRLSKRQSLSPSLSQDYTNMDDQPPQICHDSPRFKPFILLLGLVNISFVTS